MKLRILVLAAVLSLLVAAPAAAQTRTISVSGDSRLTVPNDAANVWLSATAQRRTRTAALRASSIRMRRVIRRLVALGVSRADIQTFAVTLGRKVIRRRGGRRAVRYRAANRIRVLVRQASRVGELIAEAVAAGATGVSGPEFFRSDIRAVYRRALTGAFDDARAKAQELAARSGLTLGRPISIRESTFQENTGEQRGEADVQALSAPVPVSAGTTEVEGVVYVVFEAS